MYIDDHAKAAALQAFAEASEILNEYELTPAQRKSFLIGKLSLARQDFAANYIESDANEAWRSAVDALPELVKSYTDAPAAEQPIKFGNKQFIGGDGALSQDEAVALLMQRR